MKIKRLSISRMPGFPQGLSGFEALSGRINLVFGPNGSGKSSTARMIQRLIWWDRARGMTAVGELQTGGKEVRVEIDSPAYRRRREDGPWQSADFSAALPPEFRRQYLLALHDLVGEDDRELAALIARELRGGFDLERAASLLGYSDGVYKASKQEFRNYADASDRVRRLSREQEQVRLREEKLQQLTDDIIQAEKASEERVLFERIRSRIAAKERREAAEVALQRFRPAMERLREDDLERVDRAEVRLRELEKELSESASQVAALEETIRLSEASGGEVSEEKLALLTGWIEELKRLENEGKSSGREVDRLSEELAESARMLGVTHLPDSWEGVALPSLAGLDDRIREINALQGEVERLESEVTAMEEELCEYEAAEVAGVPVDTLREAIIALRNWLQSLSGSAGIPPYAIGLLAFWGILAAVLVFLLGWPGLFSGILPVGYAGYLFYTLKSGGARDAAEVYRQGYLRLGLAAPAGWDADNVLLRLTELTASYEAAVRAGLLRKRLKEKQPLLGAQLERKKGLSEEFYGFAASLKLAGELPEGADRHQALYHFITRLQAWQKLRLQWTDARLRFRERQEACATLMERCRRELAGFCPEPSPDIIQLGHCVARLRKAFAQREQAAGQLLAERRIAAIRENERAELLSLRRSVTQRLGLSDDAAGLEELRRMHRDGEEYRTAKKTYEKLRIEEQTEEQRMKAHPGYRPGIEDISPEKAEMEALERKLRSENLSRWMEERAHIRAAIRQYGESSEIERAISGAEEAREELEGLLRENSASMTGALLVDRLRKAVTLSAQNPVLQRADRLLSRITHGRYSLTVDQEAQPGFMAYDRQTDRYLHLSELSSGTRVQLLLAVRLAYIEIREKEVRLPVLADELLANSDDQRSLAIIEALTEISRERQVFYFTAQADEVARWDILLQGVDHAVVCLGERPETTPVSRERLALFTPSVPVPAGKDHAAYGKQLGVAPFDLLEQPVEALPLWYLVEEPEILYALLSRNLSVWGALKAFGEAGGELPGITPEQWAEWEKRMELLGRIRTLCLTGRPRKINREVLADSKAVSDAFLDAMASLLEEVDGDPVRLIDRLRSKGVRNFRENKIIELEEYLAGQGYISPENPLSTDELSARIRAMVSRLELSPESAQRFTDRILIT